VGEVSAIRLRRTKKGLEVRVDDETPQSDEPIMVSVAAGHVASPTFLNLTIDEADELRNALQWSVLDARAWLEGERRTTAPAATPETTTPDSSDP
jgi:hypothetical protein